MAIVEMKALEAKSDQMNAVDLVSEMTFRIKSADYIPNDQQPVHIHFEGHEGRPYKPSKGMLRGLCSSWGNDTSNWDGKLMSIFCNPTVKWAGKEAGGIQISAISGIQKQFDFPLRLNRSQTIIHSFKVLNDTGENTKQFIFNHWQNLIETAKSVEEIGNILKQLKKEFPEKLDMLLPEASKAKELLQET